MVPNSLSPRITSGCRSRRLASRTTGSKSPGRRRSPLRIQLMTAPGWVGDLSARCRSTAKSTTRSTGESGEPVAEGGHEFLAGPGRVLVTPRCDFGAGPAKSSGLSSRNLTIRDLKMA